MGIFDFFNKNKKNKEKPSEITKSHNDKVSNKEVITHDQRRDSFKGMNNNDGLKNQNQGPSDADRESIREALDGLKKVKQEIDADPEAKEMLRQLGGIFGNATKSFFDKLEKSIPDKEDNDEINVNPDIYQNHRPKVYGIGDPDFNQTKRSSDSLGNLDRRRVDINTINPNSPIKPTPYSVEEKYEYDPIPYDIDNDYSIISYLYSLDGAPFNEIAYRYTTNRINGDVDYENYKQIKENTGLKQLHSVNDGVTTSYNLGKKIDMINRATEYKPIEKNESTEEEKFSTIKQWDRPYNPFNRARSLRYFFEDFFEIDEEAETRGYFVEGGINNEK